MSLSSLYRQYGDVDPAAAAATPTVTPVEVAPAWITSLTTLQKQSLEAQLEAVAWQQKWTEADLRARYWQIGAVLAVPLATAFWRWFLGRRRAQELGI